VTQIYHTTSNSNLCESPKLFMLFYVFYVYFFLFFLFLVFAQQKWVVILLVKLKD